MKFISSGSLLLGGVGVISGGALYSGIQKSYSEPKNLNNPSESFSLTNNETPEKNVCSIYTVKKPENRYEAKEILKKQNQSEFLAQINPSQSGFINEVKEACSGIRNHIKDENNKRIYVYQENNGSWIYAKDLQLHDWIKKSEIIISPTVNQD